MNGGVGQRFLAFTGLMFAYWLASFALTAWFHGPDHAPWWMGSWSCAATWASMTTAVTLLAWIAPVLAGFPKRWFERAAFVVCVSAFLLMGLTMLIGVLGPDYAMFRWLGKSWAEMVRDDAIIVMIVLYSPLMALVSTILCVVTLWILEKLERRRHALQEVV